MSVDKDWDRILDKYESLCESCIQLKLKAEAGEKISKSAFGKLFSSLAELRTELKEGSGSMSEQQRERFASFMVIYWSGLVITASGDWAKSQGTGSGGLACALHAAAAGTGWCP